MAQYTGQTLKVDKLVNEIINEEREDAFFDGAFNILVDAFNLSPEELKSTDYSSLVKEAKSIFANHDMKTKDDMMQLVLVCLADIQDHSHGYDVVSLEWIKNYLRRMQKDVEDFKI